MQHLTTKSFFQKNNIDSEEDKNLNSENINYIWGDTSDTKKINFLTSLIKNRFCNGRILEIGTYRGASTYNMANTLVSGSIVTVDCGYEHLKVLIEEESAEHNDKVKYSKFEVGEIYKSRLSSTKNITQIIGLTDNQETVKKIIELGPYDLIYVDAAHTYNGIKNDTELSMKCLAPGGMIIWDDYNSHWSGVNNYLNDLDATMKLNYISDNRYVIYESKES